jgi:hypothetical protein
LSRQTPAGADRGGRLLDLAGGDAWSGGSASQRLQWTSADQLPEPSNDGVEHRLGRWEDLLGLPGGGFLPIELSGELLLNHRVLEHGSDSLSSIA